MLKFFRTKKTYIYVLLTVGLFLFGIYIGFHNRPAIDKILTLSNIKQPAEIKTDFEPFWNAWNDINEKYPGANKITDQEKFMVLFLVWLIHLMTHTAYSLTQKKPKVLKKIFPVLLVA